ncbi:hypothetical protein F5B21DRAFT_217251 [Xylaria acuta]|nr:hypothetical protein F5B21DRAFT_217251 [Xylaria acuta]
MSLEKFPVCFLLCVLSAAAVGSHTKQSLTMIAGCLSVCLSPFFSHLPRPPVSKTERFAKACIQLRDCTPGKYSGISNVDYLNTWAVAERNGLDQTTQRRTLHCSEMQLAYRSRSCPGDECAGYWSVSSRAL